MGRPAILRSHFGGPEHRGFRRTPRPGNRPQKAKHEHLADTELEPQDVVPALSRLPFHLNNIAGPAQNKRPKQTEK